MNILSDIFGAVLLRNVSLGVFAALLVLNIGLAWWSYRDIVARSRNKILHVVTIVVTLVAGIFGFFLYMLVRPMHTLADSEIERMELELLTTELAQLKRTSDAPKKEKKNV